MAHRFALPMKCVFAALSAIACGAVAAQTTLPTVTVWASTSDGYTVLSPLGGSWARHGRPHCVEGTTPGTEAAGGLAVVSATSGLGTDAAGGNCIIDAPDYYVNQTKEEFCNSIKNSAPPGCTRTNFPAAPGMTSASGARWAGNGCGSTPWSTALADGVLSELWPGRYSGDINRPVAGNPSIDFALICNEHDANYTRPMLKDVADRLFSEQLQSFCRGSTDQATCQSFAGAYSTVVRNFGQTAYNEDQAQLRCASWGNILRSSECS